MLLMGVFLMRALCQVKAARQRPVTTGRPEGIIGEVGVVKEPVGVSFPGWVFVHGEWWRAVAAYTPEDTYDTYNQARKEEVIGVGRKVLVVGLEDATAVVMLFEPNALEYSTEGQRLRRI
jgi:membrane-bound ClpP family serine protease